MRVSAVHKTFTVIFTDILAVISAISELTVNFEEGWSRTGSQGGKASFRQICIGARLPCLNAGSSRSSRGSTNLIVTIDVVATSSVDFFASDHLRLTCTPARISIVDLCSDSASPRKRADQRDHRDHPESDPEPRRKGPGSHIGIRGRMRAGRIASCVVPLDVAIGTVGGISVTTVGVRTHSASVGLSVASS